MHDGKDIVKTDFKDECRKMEENKADQNEGKTQASNI
jgi:hypothetical protein